MSFKGKVAVITGGASGMGLATARILAERGVSLSLADVQAEGLEKAAKEFGDAKVTCKTMVVDVTNSAAVDAWIEATVKELGRVDFAVNCAGVGNPANTFIKDTTDEGWMMVQNVNLNGMFFCIRAQLKAMEQNGGAIVNIASSAGLRGFAYQASYAASKHGVIGLTKSAAIEAGPKVRVNCVCPGVIDTPLVRDAPGSTRDGLAAIAVKAPVQRMGTAEEVAQLMVFLLGDESSFITGSEYVIDGGLINGLS